MNSGCQSLIAKYIHRQAKQLADQFEGLREAKDIEFVHRARVATRRLRAALRMADDSFPSKRLKRWGKAIQRTTTRLGDARDRDVQIEWLCGILANLTAKECFPGISRLLVQLELDRHRLQSKVVKAVDRLEANGVLSEMRRKTKRILQKITPTEENTVGLVTCSRTRRQILLQLDDLLQHQDCLGNPEDRQQHHVMRIAAKRLRYTLEISRPIYPGQLDEAVDATKRVQSLLGDIHDCDVWIEHLDAFLVAEGKRLTSLFGHAGRLARLSPGIEHLRRDRSDCRQAAFRQLVDFWDELSRRKIWLGLAEVVLSSYPKQPLATLQISQKTEHSPLPSGINENHPLPDKPLLTAGV
jgi:CHAD domain-containing protein